MKRSGVEPKPTEQRTHDDVVTPAGERSPVSGTWQAYRETRFEADTSVGRVCILVDQRDPKVDVLLTRYDAQNWCFITAWNPHSEPLSADANRARNEELRSALTAMGLPCWFDGMGHPKNHDWVAEESFLALGIDRATAIALGRRLGQNAVVWGTRGRVAELLNCGEE